MTCTITYLVSLYHGISLPVAVVSTSAVMLMVATIIWRGDSGGTDDYFPEI
jgi:hypothetical protein